MFLYRFIIFLGSFLLFLIQPIMAKYFLPFFGGESNVWIASMLFFMTMLFVGYLYSYWLTLSLSKKHREIHLLVVIFSVGLLIVHAMLNNWITPIMPKFSEIFHVSNPMFMVMAGLFLSIGIPYFLLSTTSILVQYWASKTQDNPYDLYNYSNLGGVLAILCYPIALEAYLPLNIQGNIWAILFVLYGILILILMYRAPINKKDENIGLITPFKGIIWIFWILITTLTTAILLTATEVLTSGISAGPFSWLLPLLGYMVSYIFAFRTWKISTFQFIIKYIKFISSLVFLYILLLGILNIKPNTVVNVLTSKFFIIVSLLTMVLPLFFVYAHRILYLLRPTKKLLPFYYLCIAVGGVFGGLIINVFMPLFFDNYFEISLVTTGFILLVILKESLNKNIFIESGFLKLDSKKIVYLSIFSISFVFIASFIGDYFLKKNNNDVIYRSRNFYGVLTVTEHKEKNDIINRELINGNIIHGEENIKKGEKSLPVSYYVKKSGLGVILDDLEKKNKNLKVGILGLGSGEIASYCKSGDKYVFYEINKEVIKVAHNYFTYLDSCDNTEVVLGDARIKLEEELKKEGSRNFDVIVIDVFSDDAIPVHLLTNEAFDLYKKHLKKDGVLLVHISNNFLDLLPIMKNQVERLDKKMLYFSNAKWRSSKNIKIKSSWVAFVNKENLRYDKYSTQKKYIKDIKPWTDNYSYIFSIIRW